MGVGYNTLDLAMLLIAALVIWAASRIPVKEEGTKGIAGRPGLKLRTTQRIPYPECCSTNRLLLK